MDVGPFRDAGQLSGRASTFKPSPRTGSQTAATVLALRSTHPQHIGARRTGARPAALAAGAAAAAVVVGFLALRTRAGQRWDANPMLGRWSSRPSDVEVLSTWLEVASVVVMVAAAIAGLALLRRRADLRAASLLIGAVVGANLTTQVLKRVLVRPPLIDDSPLQSFPSGHTTGAASLLMAVVVVSAARDRAAAALVAIFGTELIGVGVVATGWHRPSDAIGAVLICTAWVAAATALLPHPPAAPGPPGAWTWAGRVGAGVLIGVCAVLSAAEVTRRGVALLGGRHIDEGRILAQAAAVALVATAAVALLTWCAGGRRAAEEGDAG